MFSEIEKKLEEISVDTTGIKTKESHNYNYFGVAVPSVTTILSKCIHEDYITNWANYLGFKRIKYKDELNRAALAGTNGHNAIEKFLKDGVDDLESIPLQSFKIWWDMITSTHKVEILGMEEKITLPYCGGTYDLLLKIDDRIFLVDLKTSNNLSYKYFIQLAAYRHMLYKARNINIDGCLILQVDKAIPSFNEQVLDFAIDEHYQFIEHCAFTFISLVLAYYNIHKAEYMWNNIF